MGWQSVLKHDPLPRLLTTDNEAVAFFARRDLLEESEERPDALWDLSKARRLVSRQGPNGSWKYPGGNPKIRSFENYDQIETFRNLGYLVEIFGFDKTSSVIVGAAEFLLSFQTSQGDIRGILGNQYTPYYSAAILELLMKAGYAEDPRIEKVFQWLRSARQDDGGWAIPLRTRKKNLGIIASHGPPLEPDRSKPFSHLVTGVVLRAYAAHERHRTSPEAVVAGKLLLSRFFKRDRYPDRSSSDFWLRFTYPFWFTDLISATDSLSKIGFSLDEPEMERAIEWFISQQQDTGLWKLKTLKNERSWDTDLWLSLAICRIIKRLKL